MLGMSWLYYQLLDLLIELSLMFWNGEKKQQLTEAVWGRLLQAQTVIT